MSDPNEPQPLNYASGENSDPSGCRNVLFIVALYAALVIIFLALLGWLLWRAERG